MPGEKSHAEEETAPAEAETQAEAQTDAESESDAATADDQADRAPASASDWPELDGYCDELHSGQTEWAERVSAVRLQLAQLQSALIGIASQQRTLGIAEDLERLNESVLGGAAVAQTLRLGYGLERYLALFWPAALDPRPALARPSSEGEYRVEVYLHVGPDGNGRIRVEGAKRLEAPLPTSRARLRGVLLRAIQEPKLVHAGDAAGEQPPVAPEQEGGRPETVDAPEDDRPADPRSGDADEQPPPEEQVIPLGPSEEDRPVSESEEASQSG